MGSVDELSIDSVKDIIDHVRKSKRKRPDKDSIRREAELRHGLDKDTVAHMLDKLTLEKKLCIKESYFVNESHVNETINSRIFFNSKSLNLRKLMINKRLWNAMNREHACLPPIQSIQPESRKMTPSMWTAIFSKQQVI